MANDEIETGCICHSCGKMYKVDIVVPDEIWLKISPKEVDGYKGGGLLCGSCIMSRIESLTNNPDYFYLRKY